jgi:hypothetical protein
MKKSLFLGLYISRSFVPDETNDGIRWILSKMPNEFELYILVHNQSSNKYVVTNSQTTTSTSDKIGRHD